MILRFGSVDYNVLYVDPSISTAGDGSLPTTPLANLPALASLVDKTCFIIRRTVLTAACQHIYGTTSTIPNLIFMGMPKATDPMYCRMPAEAKSAWDADTEDYARIKITGDQLLTLNSLNNLRCHRVCFFRSTGTTISNYFFTINDSSIANISFDKCKFTHQEGDIPNYTAVVPIDRYGRYFYANGIHSFNFSDCEFHHGNSTGYHSVYVRNAQHGNYSGNVVHAITCHYDANAAELCTNNSYQGRCLRANNNKAYFYCNGAQTLSEYVPRIFATGCMDRVEVKSLTISYAGTLGTYTKTLQCIRNVVNLGCDRMLQYDIQDITLNLGKCWNFGDQYPAVVIDPSYSADCTDYKNIVRNIVIQAAETGGYGDFSTYDASDNIDGYNWPLAIYIPNSDQHLALVENITVNNPRGKAARLQGCNAKNVNIKGTLWVANAIVSVPTLETWFPGRAVYCASGGNLYIGTATVNKANATYPYNDDTLAISRPPQHGFLYVEQSNSRVFNNDLASDDSHSNEMFAIAVGNEISDGNFKQLTNNYLCQTWNVNRTGGAPACLKLEGTTNSSSSTFMAIGRYPYKGIEITPMQTGPHLARMHVATKGLSSFDALEDKLQIEVEVKTASGLTQTYRSNLCGAWSDDAASVWNNDSDLSQYVLEMPVEIKLLEAVDFRIFYNYYSATGFAYIDPAIELTPIT